MCGRFTETAAFDVLAERFGIEEVEADTKELSGRYNVAPPQLVPAILDPRDERRWLNLFVVTAARVLPCLRPLPVERIEIYPVSTLVSSLRNEGAQLVEPVIVYTKVHEQPN